MSKDVGLGTSIDGFGERGAGSWRLGGLEAIARWLGAKAWDLVGLSLGGLESCMCIARVITSATPSLLLLIKLL